MDRSQAGYLLIGTTMIILVVFLLALLVLMLIYRKRKLEHLREVNLLNEKFQQEILQTQLDIQRDTMQQIGREIHDNVGQKLTLASLYAVHPDMENGSEVNRDKILSIGELINESLTELRNLSRSLTHSLEAGLNLGDLLEREMIKMNEAGSCDATLKIAGEPVVLAPEINNMFFRVAQEFIQNSIRHSNCTQLSCLIEYLPGVCHLHLEDNGKGFSIADTTIKRGIGIENMKKRAVLLGAEFLLNSVPGQGTTLDIHIRYQTP